MTYSFHPDAELELYSSIDYYESCKKDLGLEFAQEIHKTIKRILEYPNAWQKLDGDIRRCLVNRFPFAIIYYQKDREIIILAIMELHQKPNYWHGRGNE